MKREERCVYRKPGMSTSVRTHSAEETRDFGKCLGAALQPGDVVALEGDLGTGKTILVQGIAEALGVTASVHSPTFVLHHRYPGTTTLDHYDLFRLRGLDWVDSGLDEPSPDAVTVVEWSDRALPLREWATVHIVLEASDNHTRTLTCLKAPETVQVCFNGSPSRP